MTAAFRIVTREYQSIQQIDANSWARLNAESPLSSVGWLKTVEATLIGNSKPLYITAENPAGRILGAAVCYHASRGPIIGDFDHIGFGRLKPLAHKLGISFMPLLVCGPLYAYGEHILLEDNADRQNAPIIMNSIVDRIEKIATASGLSLAFTNIVEGEHELMQQLTQRRFVCVNDLPLAALDINWDDFDGYLAFLSQLGRKKRKNVNAEINRIKKSGVEIRPIENRNLRAHRILELLNLTCSHYNNAPFMFSQDFFSMLESNMGENAVVYGAFRGKVLNGVSIHLKGLTEGSVIFVGVDHQAAGNDYSYFNLGYNVPIADAISAGLKRLYFDRHMYTIKRRRGCKFINTYFLFKPHKKLSGLLSKSWFRVLGWWNKRVGPNP
jgi:predicted N-acyltransferase